MGRLPICALIYLLLAALTVGCGNSDSSDGDGTETTDTERDASVVDAAVPDTETNDTETEDAGVDSDSEDAGTPDAGEPEQWEDGECLNTDTDPDYVTDIGCYADYVAVAAPPLAASIPGVLSTKTVIDRIDDHNLYFQNSRRYPIHYDFASTHLSGNGLPMVVDLSAFNEREYYSQDRRFILGALNYYEGPKVWAYEIAPYDSASAEMIEIAFEKIKAHFWLGDKLKFHPTSDTVAHEAEKLPDTIPIIATEDLFKGIDYQPLNLATSMGMLRFFSTEEIETEYLSFRDIAVLETIPNDISVCSGTITAELQTPLAHINVLAQNRGIPNMALIGAFDHPELRALEGKWVSLTVGAQDFTIEEVDKSVADAWWEAHKPQEVILPTVDLSVVDMRDIEDVLELDTLTLDEALAKAIPAFGGKASHYGAFPHIETVAIPYPDAFVIPISFYWQFMEENGFLDRIGTMLESESFQSDPAERESSLGQLRADIESTPLDADFEAALIDKLNTDFPDTRMRFRSSTNCEDLGGFTGAGLYESKSGDPNDPERPVADAVRKVWASVWRFRAFEEREYRSISHNEVGMAVLVHRSFPDEAVNGVAITANIFDTAVMEPGYYINAQVGDVSVVLPPEGITSDQFLYYFDMPRQPIEFIAHSNLVPEGETVMSRSQVAELAGALEAIHLFFNELYGPNTPDHFYGMDVEFKFNTDDTSADAVPELVIKQARPYPGRGGQE